MPKFFYGIILAILTIVVLFIFTKPLQESPDSTDELLSEELLSEIPTEDTANISYPIIVLDAGHGGMDPGKVGINNALEKDINLSIVLKLKKLLEKEGFQVSLTRTSDQLLAAPNSTSQKKDDMIARIEMVKQLDPYFTISIHQNSFPDSSVSGPQVFYYKDSIESATMAQVLQDILNNQLEPAKKRSPQANTNYYLLTRTPTPTVIVECGFLSNQAEADLLIQEDYQSRVAHAIYLGILAYYEASTSTQISSE